MTDDATTFKFINTIRITDEYGAELGPPIVFENRIQARPIGSTGIVAVDLDCTSSCGQHMSCSTQKVGVLGDSGKDEDRSGIMKFVTGRHRPSPQVKIGNLEFEVHNSVEYEHDPVKLDTEMIRTWLHSNASPAACPKCDQSLFPVRWSEGVVKFADVCYFCGWRR